MNELKTLDVVDDRTIEQIREDGDEWLDYGVPYILRGVCCVCGNSATEPNHICLIHLDKPVECESHLLVQEPQQCTGLAHWVLNMTAACDKCILDCVEHLPDNHEWLAPALADIEQRERRRHFFRAMRHPEMRLVRQALRHIAECGDDWRAITQLDALRYGYRNDCWYLATKTRVVITLDADNPAHTPDDFFSVRLHNPDDPACQCEDCDEMRLHGERETIVCE